MAAATAPAAADHVGIAVSGASGRIGKLLLSLAAEDEELIITQALVSESSAAAGKPVTDLVSISMDEAPVVSCEALAEGSDVMIDFSTPEATMVRAEQAADHGTAIVIGTTGLTEEQLARLKELSERVPVLVAHNFSLGVNLLCRIAADVARALGEDFDIEVVESHHNRKVDAPSGTALGIAGAIASALDRDVAKDLRCGREGRSARRTKREIGMHSLRMGNVVGEHTAHFASDYERVELTHKAQSRDVFAAGALRAAKWISGMEAGWYTMDDVLFRRGE